jgi:hypothetical protein
MIYLSYPALYPDHQTGPKTLSQLIPLLIHHFFNQKTQPFSRFHKKNIFIFFKLSYSFNNGYEPSL